MNGMIALSRREALIATSSLCVAAQLPPPQSTSLAVAKLVEEMASTPRAMRDGNMPYVDPAVAEMNLPNNSYDYAIETATRSKDLAARARKLAAQPLSQDDRETLGALIWDLERDVGLAPYYWHEFPLGYLPSQLERLSNQLDTPSGRDEIQGYLARVRQTPAYVRHIRERLLGQLSRKLTAPHTEAVRALEQMRIEAKEITDSIEQAAKAAEGGSPADQAFAREARQIAKGPLADSFAALDETLTNQYIPPLTERSGVAMAEDAPAYYRELAKLRLSDDVDLHTIHEQAKESLAAIDADLARMRKSLGVPSDPQEFYRSMAGDPRWFVRDAEDLKSRLEAAQARIEPIAKPLFFKIPKTPRGVAPLPEALSDRLLNGFYSRPTETNPKGTYFYNTSRLDISNWAWITPMISHELMPGHHLQAALLFENSTLSPYRKDLFVQACKEGWGEYARELMEQSGLYENDPWGLYASRLLERRFALRTVVETGVNDPSWTWQKADAGLATDPLTRPGTTRQLALSAATFRSVGALYWWGLRRFREIRKAAESKAGSSFDIRRFHATVMHGDLPPFSLIEQRLADA